MTPSITPHTVKRKRPRHGARRKFHVDVGRWWLGYFNAGSEVYLCLIPGWVIIRRRTGRPGKPEGQPRIYPHL